LNKKVMILTIAFLAAIMLTPTLSTVQACGRKEKANVKLDFLIHMENNIADYSSADAKWYPLSVMDNLDPPYTQYILQVQPEGARFMTVKGALYHINPTASNYIKIGDTEIPLNPENYEGIYSLFWIYHDDGSGTGFYSTKETYTLDSAEFKGTIRVTAREKAVSGNGVFEVAGTFDGFGIVNGQRIQVKGERHLSLNFIPDPPFFETVLENEGTIEFLTWR
jgi:hypothetical protein